MIPETKNGAKVPNRDEEARKGSFHSKTELEHRDSHTAPPDETSDTQKGEKNGGA